MNYQPRPGTIRETIYQCIDSTPRTVKDIAVILNVENKNVSKAAIISHLRKLTEYGVITKSGSKYTKTTDTSNNKKSNATLILDYLKANIGKTVNARSIREDGSFKFSRTAISTELGKLAHANALERLPGEGKAFNYLIKPDVKTFEKIPSIKKSQEIVPQEFIPIPKDDIPSMTIGEIFGDYMRLKEENVKLKNALQRIYNEILHVVDVD
jgi:hypothetical protein